MTEYLKPYEIEARSMQIIEEEIGDRIRDIDPERLPIIKRVIHTTADFDYLDSLTFTNDAIARFKEYIRGGCTIVTDTRMAYSGINKKRLEKYNVKVVCFMDDESVAAEAQQRQVTRASVSMERAASLGGDVIIVCGNAPTALIAVDKLLKEDECCIKGVIAVPVGFVNVVEAKELIIGDDIPCIAARGRKGGSNVAASIVNAIVYSME